MPDFSLNTYTLLLQCLKDQKYRFQPFAVFKKEPATRAIILRHDVDARKMNSLKTAQIENEMGIQGTYYFRMVPESYDKKIIKQIHELGHEIGYHYEDLSRCAASGILRSVRSRGSTNLHDLHNKVLSDRKLAEMAIVSFRENLEKLRRIVPIETICMHGSPLSKWDNRLLWKYYDYREFGIIGEPYFDTDFNEVLYLTDTGRRWDGDSVSIRDKVKVGESAEVNKRAIEKGRKGEREKGRDEELQKVASDPQTKCRMPGLRFKSTFDIIRTAESGTLPGQIMITVHPQRWTNESIPWIWELIWQNFKNLGKNLITSWQKS